MTGDKSRREALSLLALFGLAPVGLGSGIDGVTAVRAEHAGLLRALGGDDNATVTLGEAYLETLQADDRPPSPEQHIAVLATELRRKLGADGTLPDNAEAMRARYRALLRADFAQWRVAEVRGWVLAQTECELYALAALTA